MVKNTLSWIHLIIVANTAADAYIIGQPGSHSAAVLDLAVAQKGKHVEIRLDICEEEGSRRLGLNGLEFEFLGDEVHAGADYPSLLTSAKRGPLATKASSPLQSIRKISDPSYIDITGMKKVEMSNGCWKLFFKEGAPSGAIVCGFNFPEETNYKNGATLSSRDVYITFNVWSGKHLSAQRDKKLQAFQKASHYEREKEEWMEKGRAARGLLEWASKYRKAMIAAENYSKAGKKRFRHIPDEEDTIKIMDDMYLSRKGTVWTGEMKLGKLMHKTLGTAVVARAPDQ